MKQGSGYALITSGSESVGTISNFLFQGLVLFSISYEICCLLAHRNLQLSLKCLSVVLSQKQKQSTTTLNVDMQYKL